jgi:hypothetical protein
VVGHNLGTFLQRARSGRGCSARASAGDRAVAAQDGLDRYAVSRDHRRIIDAGGRYPQLMGLGVGKRRWYATIFSFDKPRSRSISTERRGRSLSRAGPTPRSSSPSLPCRPLVFTCASSVSSRQFLPLFQVNVALLKTTRIAFMRDFSEQNPSRRGRFRAPVRGPEGPRRLTLRRDHLLLGEVQNDGPIAAGRPGGLEAIDRHSGQPKIVLDLRAPVIGQPFGGGTWPRISPAGFLFV